MRCDESYRPAVRAHCCAAELLARRTLTPDVSEFMFHPGATEFQPGQYALLYLPRAPGARACLGTHSAQPLHRARAPATAPVAIEEIMAKRHPGKPKPVHRRKAIPAGIRSASPARQSGCRRSTASQSWH